jgi:hypothetical protein
VAIHRSQKCERPAISLWVRRWRSEGRDARLVHVHRFVTDAP